MCGLCAVGILCSSHDSFGLIQLRCRMIHYKAIYTGKLQWQEKQNSHCSLTVQDKGISFNGKRSDIFKTKSMIVFFTSDRSAVTSHISVEPK